MTTPRLMLCTDLDRTLLPNAAQPESPSARASFARLVSHAAISLVYVTGRHRALVEREPSRVELFGDPILRKPVAEMPFADVERHVEAVDPPWKRDP